MKLFDETFINILNDEKLPFYLDLLINLIIACFLEIFLNFFFTFQYATWKSLQSKFGCSSFQHVIPVWGFQENQLSSIGSFQLWLMKYPYPGRLISTSIPNRTRFPEVEKKYNHIIMPIQVHRGLKIKNIYK